MGNGRLRSGAVVVHSLHLQLIRNERGRSGHDELGVVCHGHCGPVDVSGLLPPHDFVMKPWTVRLEAGQRLQRVQKFSKLLGF